MLISAIIVANLYTHLVARKRKRMRAIGERLSATDVKFLTKISVSSVPFI